VALAKQLEKPVEHTDADAVTAPTQLYHEETVYQDVTDKRQSATMMTHFAARQYTKWLSKMSGSVYRLPCEAEWEYACRGSVSNPNRYAPFSFGDDLSITERFGCQFSDLFSQYMWWCGNMMVVGFLKGSKPVGTKHPNDYGLYDMHGNVWEMCQDFWHDTYNNAPNNGSAWEVGGGSHVIRGGSWGDTHWFCRSAFRSYVFNIPRQDYLIGLRVVREVVSLQSTTNLTATPTPTWTPTSTPTPTLSPTQPSCPITIPLPNLPEGARPLRLVRIPAGSFLMGNTGQARDQFCGCDNCDCEKPRHQVTIGSDFYIGETEVTLAQWIAVMKGNPSEDWGFGDNYPAHDISLNDCQSFIETFNRIGQGTFRLPSEAEWEHACRAWTTTRFYFGDSLSCADENQDCAAGTLPGDRSDYMWYWFNYNTPTYGSKPVRSKLPNAFGLYDMHGNVWEWCQDYWHENYNGAPTDGSSWVVPTSGSRVIRGGAWDYGAWNCRSAVRLWYYPACWSYYFGGLRVVLPVSP